MNLLPTTSAREPQTSSVQPHVKEKIDAGLFGNQSGIRRRNDRHCAMKQNFSGGGHRKLVGCLAYHNRRLALKPMSAAIVGIPTVSTPASKLLTPVMKVTVAIIVAVLEPDNASSSCNSSSETLRPEVEDARLSPFCVVPERDPLVGARVTVSG